MTDTDGMDQPAGAAAPDFLPRDLSDFTGRAYELDELTAVATAAAAGTAAGPGAAAARVRLCAICGMAGIGKTALAVHAAHRLAGGFPDARLFIDLHGYSEGLLPVDPVAALGVLLGQLGVSADRIPDDLAGRTALWRRELAGRRALIVVDNAADAGHVRPLLPAEPGCLVLVTSRRRLDGLSASHTVELDVLPEPAAVELFEQAAGGLRPDDPTASVAAAEVVRLCGHLPVAIRIAAARLRSGRPPEWTVAALADRLRDEHRRLTELASADRSVVASFVLSHRQLDPLPRRLFRLLGLVPGPDVDAYAAAALAGVPLGDAGRALDELVDAHLLLPRAAGRYTFHDLLRQHARRTAQLEETEAGTRAATTRLLDYYLHTTAAAADLIMRNRRAGAVDVANPPDAAPAFADPAAATGWLLAERVNLMAAVNHAAQHGWPTHTWQLAHALWWLFHLRGYTTDLVATQSVALSAVCSTSPPDRRGEATVLTDLGGAFAQSGLPGEAVPLLERALVLHRELGDRQSAAASLLNLAGAYYRLGADSDAIDRGNQAREAYRELGDRYGEVTALNNVGIAYNQAGEPDQAIVRLGEALEIRAQLGEAPGLARVLSNYGWSLTLLGRPEEALRYLREALELNRQSGSKWDEGSIMSDMGVAYARLGEFDTAFDCHREALVMIRPMAQRGIEGELRNRAGETFLLAGRYDGALDHYRRALALASQAGERHHQARALDGMACCYQELGRPDQARAHWQRALVIFTDLRHRDADTIRTVLASL